ncbi:MAG: shikimate dehydrogenase [Desulfobacterales bacterium]|nr:shikimate dehydrogenase [Desulfobacterales bacterium]
MGDNPKDNDNGLDAVTDIVGLRAEIDDIDNQILDLLGRRVTAAKTIGSIKRRAGTIVVDKQREGEIYRRLLSSNQKALKAGPLHQIYRSIISAGRSVQKSASGSGEPAVYSVFGDPVGHSLSPVMHNSALARAGLDGYYLAFRVKDIAAAVSGIRGLGIRGASITIPHKIRIMDYLDQIDPLAVAIGAVNTVVNDRGTLHGYNTDCFGAVQALSEKTPIKDQDVAIVGAGGGARAAGFGIKQEGGRLTIINRSRERGEKLASDLNCAFKPLEEVDRLPYKIIINATSVGMTPRDDSRPLNTDMLGKDTVVMDMVYNPLQTRFLAEAGQIGCTTVDGAAMFVHQGAVQFELWTGEKAPVDVMYRVVLEELSQ